MRLEKQFRLFRLNRCCSRSNSVSFGCRAQVFVRFASLAYFIVLLSQNYLLSCSILLLSISQSREEVGEEAETHERHAREEEEACVKAEEEEDA